MVYEAAAMIEEKISEELNHYSAGRTERRAHDRKTWVI